MKGDGGIGHHLGQRCSVRTADPTIRPRSVGSAVRTNDLTAVAVAGMIAKAAVRTNDLAAGAVAGIMTKAAVLHPGYWESAGSDINRR